MPDENEEVDFSDYEVEVDEEIESEEDSSEDETETEEESEAEDEQSTEEEQASEAASENSAPTATLAVENLEVEPLDQKAVNLTVSLEVGRVTLSLEKLLELQEGNLLELDAKLDQPINLVIGDRCVGRGELIKVGDSLGVRILEMA